MAFDHILDAVFAQPWAMQPERLRELADAVAHRVINGKLSPDELEARIGAGPGDDAGTRRRGAVAVLPLHGVISQRMGMLQAISGGVGTDAWGAEFAQLAADDSLAAIVLDVHSPGGNIYGVTELAQRVFDARKPGRPIIAVANSLMASAAYWIASQADQVVVTPSGDVGSIGVYTAHQDQSVAEEKAGIKTTIIAAGEFKAELAPHLALSDEARAALTERVQGVYGQFVADVARGRGATAEIVRAGYGRGRVLRAGPAVAAGLADRIATLDQVLAELGTQAPAPAPQQTGAISPELRRRFAG